MREVRNCSFNDAAGWQYRLRAKVPRPVVFINGSGLSLFGNDGVWGVKQIMTEAQQCLAGTGPRRPEQAEAAPTYQSVMEELQALAPYEADRLIRRAVLQACTARAQVEQALRAEEQEQRDLCSSLQNDSSAWRIPPAVTAQAELIRRLEEERRKGATSPCVLTTNFDGLLEVALDRCGVRCSSMSVVEDTWPKLGLGVSILHVHGFWTDSVTLHSRRKLAAKRERLQAALQSRFDSAEIWVMGYGAWEDVIFTSIRDVVLENRFDRSPRIVWSFREDAPTALAHYPHVFDAFREPSTEIAYFEGVDLQAALPAVVAEPELQAAAPADPDEVEGARAQVATPLPQPPRARSSEDGVLLRTRQLELRREGGQLHVGYDGQSRFQVFIPLRDLALIAVLVLIVSLLLPFFVSFGVFLGVAAVGSLITFVRGALPTIKTTLTGTSLAPTTVKGALAVLAVFPQPIGVAVTIALTKSSNDGRALVSDVVRAETLEARQPAPLVPPSFAPTPPPVPSPSAPPRHPPAPPPRQPASTTPPPVASTPPTPSATPDTPVPSDEVWASADFMGDQNGPITCPMVCASLADGCQNPDAPMIQVGQDPYCKRWVQKCLSACRNREQLPEPPHKASRFEPSTSLYDFHKQETFQLPPSPQPNDPSGVHFNGQGVVFPLNK